MNKSELIELWYTEFCMLNKKPRPDFQTFCNLMKRNGFDLKKTMVDYEKLFQKKPLTD
jgi:hypothetical protein